MFFCYSPPAQNRLHKKRGCITANNTFTRGDLLLTCEPGKFWCAVLFTHHTGPPGTWWKFFQTYSCKVSFFIYASVVEFAKEFMKYKYFKYWGVIRTKKKKIFHKLLSWLKIVLCNDETWISRACNLLYLIYSQGAFTNVSAVWELRCCTSHFSTGPFPSILPYVTSLFFIYVI